MKANYKPIAMKCSQEQFDSIKDLITVPIYDIVSFNVCPYLLLDENKKVTNCTIDYLNVKSIDILIYFDDKYFIECCNQGGLEDVSEQTWEGSELQYRNTQAIVSVWNDFEEWIEIRKKPKQNLDADIEALYAKAKELGIKLTILTE